jgi:two-component system, response regulator
MGERLTLAMTNPAISSGDERNQTAMDASEVMIIEDNPYDVDMMKDAFRDHHISDKLQVLRDGAEAIDYFFGPQGCIQRIGICFIRFVLLDLKLPKVDGLEILKRLKSDERTREIPVIIFSSSNEVRDRKQSYLLGANSYIVKPLDADHFSLVVAEIGSYWLTRNRTAYQDR